MRPRLRQVGSQGQRTGIPIILFGSIGLFV